MKKVVLTLLSVFFLQLSYAQLNMSLLSNVQYDQDLNDIWGWAAPDGTEYALVGLRNGLSIVSLADPNNAEEVAFVPGPSTTWRDIKTWEDHAYVTNEAGDGLLVVDLSNLPNNFSDDDWYYWAPDVNGFGNLSSIHNIYIDEFGYAYLAGPNVGGFQGVIFVDVFTDPHNPQIAGVGPNVYSHDVYTRDNISYNSEIYEGTLTIYDVSDKSNPIVLGSQPTPANFTHNAWLSDDSNVVFTTDEIAGAPVAAYDISDFNNITELDQYRPIETLGSGVIPHNVHVWNDWLVISYYTDGGIIVDASRPQNLIEVGNFDTWLGGDGGFSGAWGLYPFLPSGTVLVSDIGNGLYVLDANYVRACWLEGKVTDSVTGDPIGGATVIIDSPQANLGETDGFGDYESGQAIPGTFDVTVSAFGYQSKTVPADLENGVVTILNVELNPLQTFTVSGNVFKNEGGTGIADAIVNVISEETVYSASADASGNFDVSGILPGTYDLVAGAWGYNQTLVEGVEISGNNAVSVGLDEGYKDDFVLDLGWEATASSTNGTGFWVRDIPIETNFNNGARANPHRDIDGDIGGFCYMTGNGGGNVGTDDVDDITVTLTSPVMDLSGYQNPLLSYRAWFVNDGGNGNPNDAFVINISNGIETVELETITASVGNWRPISGFYLTDFIELTDNMTIIFETGDQGNSGHVVEAGLDGFEVIDDFESSTFELEESGVRMSVFPNPFKAQLSLEYELKETFNQGFIQIYNSLGQKVQTIEIQDQRGRFELGRALQNGFYLIQLEADGKLSKSLKIFKTN